MTSHPLVAATLSAFVPGAGQLYAKRPARAAMFFAPVLLLLGSSVALASRDTVELAALAVRPAVLSGVLVVDVALLIWRFAAVVDAYRIIETSRDRSWMPVTLTLILALVAIPHLIAWSYTSRTIAALESVFVAAPEDGAVSLEPPPTTLRDTLPDPVIYIDHREFDPRSARNYMFRPGIGDPDAVANRVDILAPPSPEAPFLPFTERVNPERLTILLVGGDAGPGREGLRTDSMNVVTVDLTSGRAAMFGLPRNLKMVPLPKHLRNAFIDYEEKVKEKDLTDADEDGYPDAWVDTDGDGIPEEPPFESCHCFPDMLNKVHRETEDWTRTYPDTPDPGLAALRDVVSNLLDLPIDYYVMVEMAGFVRTIDTLGGVDVYVEEPYHVMVSSPEEGKPKAKINVEPGVNHLTGLEALAYARWRIGSSDYDRMGRQRCIIKAAVTEADPVTLIRSYPTLLELIDSYVTTDVPLSLLPDLVQIAGSIDYDNITTIGFVPPRYNSGRTPGKYPIPNVDRIRSKVREVLANEGLPQGSSGTSECGPIESE